MTEKTWAARLRSFFRELFGSRYARHLEAEIVRQRMEYEARIRELIAEKLELLKKVHEFEVAMLPQVWRRDVSIPRTTRDWEKLARETGPSHWKQALEAHNEIEFAEDKKEEK